MFTGIIETIGIVQELKKQKDFAVLAITLKGPLDGIKVSDSVSVNGICLTVTKKHNKVLCFDVSSETLCKTTIGLFEKADRVNLERALKFDSRLGGHFVTGHIDCVSKIKKITTAQKTTIFEFYLEKQFLKYVAKKCSVAIDGISLTVAEVFPDSFTAAVIPYTMSNTTLGFKSVNSLVNLETDILAKYVFRVIDKRSETKITPKFLAEHGFL